MPPPNLSQMKFLLASLLASGSLLVSATPALPHYFDQLVDHFVADPGAKSFKQRYYEDSTHFKGPGHPIFLIMGGEGEITPETGIFYPFIQETLASKFGAYVIEPEHRFYGESSPVARSSVDESDFILALRSLMTPSQALADAVNLVKHLQKDVGCGPRGTAGYCPVVAVGGSYPGFLSFLMRLRYPSVVDMSYAASAPVLFYAQQVEQHAYYDVVAKSADRSLPGCSGMVRKALDDVAELVSESDDVQQPLARIGVCGNLPGYITDTTTLKEELMMVVGYSFAGLNMANYPPTNSTGLHAACQTFADSSLSSFEKVSQFLLTVNDSGEGCFDMNSQLPSGSFGTISSGDWSGVGTGDSGEMWDFQTCSLLVEQIGYSNMFPDREWTFDWLNEHCEKRFGLTPSPTYLSEMFGFRDVKTSGASKVIFTNGLNDGWVVGSITETLAEGDLVAFNFPNGAHHSDLSHSMPGPDDTPDVQQGHKDVEKLIGKWLKEITVH